MNDTATIQGIINSPDFITFNSADEIAAYFADEKPDTKPADTYREAIRILGKFRQNSKYSKGYQEIHSALVHEDLSGRGGRRMTVVVAISRLDYSNEKTTITTKVRNGSTLASTTEVEVAPGLVASEVASIIDQYAG